MKRVILLVAAALVWAQPFANAADITASAELSWIPEGSNLDDATKLTNFGSSDASIGIFWYGWVPGEDFLATSPTNHVGWSSRITHIPNAPTNGCVIQWTNGSDSSASAIAPGASLDFSFTNADIPARLAGNFIFYRGYIFYLSGGPIQ